MFAKYQKRRQDRIRHIALSRLNQYGRFPTYSAFKMVTSLYGYSSIQQIYKIIHCHSNAKGMYLSDDYICIEPNSVIIVGTTYNRQTRVFDGLNYIYPRKDVTDEHSVGPLTSLSLKSENIHGKPVTYKLLLRPSFAQIFSGHTASDGRGPDSIQPNIDAYHNKQQAAVRRYRSYVNNDNNESFLRDISWNCNISMSLLGFIKSVAFYALILVLALLYFHIYGSSIKVDNSVVDLGPYLFWLMTVGYIIQLVKYFNHLGIPRYMAVLAPVVLFVGYIMMASLLS